MGFVPDKKQTSGRFVPDVQPETIRPRISEKPKQEEINQFSDIGKGISSGLIKGGANLLDTAQKAADIITRPIRITDVKINEKSSMREKLMGQSVKLEVIPNAVQAFSNQADMARTFAEDYLKPQTTAGKVSDVLSQAPAFVTEVASTTPSFAGKISLLPKVRVGAQTVGLGVLGAIQGSEGGKFGAESVKQSATNIVMGKIFEGISRISPTAYASTAEKIIKTLTRGVAGGAVGGATSMVSGGGIYEQDPDKADRLIVDSVASAIMTSIPSGKPRDIAKSLDKINSNREKLTNEFLGKIKSDVDRTADLVTTEAWGVERPATAMFAEVFKKPLKSYREVIGTVEDNIQSVQSKKASTIINSEKNIQSDPTLGLKSLISSEITNPGGSNPAAAAKLKEILASEQSRIGKNMSVSDAWKRQSELKFELNDDAMRAKNRPPLTRLQKMANEALIKDYNRAIGEIHPEFRKLGAKEQTLITLKDLIVNKSASYQVTPKEGIDTASILKDVAIRANPFLSTLQGLKNLTYDIINHTSGPVEGKMKRIIDLQKKVNKLSELQGKKLSAEEEIKNFSRGQIVPVKGQEFTMGASFGPTPQYAARPVKNAIQIMGPEEQIRISGPTSPQLQIGRETGFTNRDLSLQEMGFVPPSRLQLPPPERGFTMKSPNAEYIQERIKEIGRGVRAESKLPKGKKLKYIYEKGEK